MIVTAAKYWPTNVIRATIDGTIWIVPKNEDNRHYKAILEWVDAGNTIAAAD
jgi:hypothetical protein